MKEIAEKRQIKVEKCSMNFHINKNNKQYNK